MKAYWESSALVTTFTDPSLRGRLRRERGFTRTHSLSETFSALTGGNIQIRVPADRAVEMLADLATDLDFLELTPSDILDAVKSARQKGVRGGRIHDFLHMVAAEKSGAVELLTADQNDFSGLSNSLRVVQI